MPGRMSFLEDMGERKYLRSRDLSHTKLQNHGEIGPGPCPFSDMRAGINRSEDDRESPWNQAPADEPARGHRSPGTAGARIR